MKNILLISCASLALIGCNVKNEDGSDKSTYSSCKIVSSEALFSSDRVNDLSQCWNAEGDGYSSKGDALQWCERTVNEYMDNRYIFGHSVTFAIESTYCP